MMLKTNGEFAYFAASNSKKGFCSYYKECFDSVDVKRVFAIKGGPGTGKSRFLRDVAEYATARAWGVEYVYCSSDPTSRDGVILKNGRDCIALLDATAPHVYEPMHPGIREEIVNLGEFWSVEKLTEHAEEIERKSIAKGAAYRRAYRYLAGAGEMEETRRELTSPYLRRDAITRFAQKLTAGLGKGTEFEMRPALIRSVGMRGSVGLDSFFAAPQRIVLLSDCHGAATELLTAILACCAERRLSVRVSYDPVFPEQIDGLFLPDSSVAFVKADGEECPYPHRSVSVRRFVDTARMRGDRRAILYATRMRDALLSGACEALADAEQHHFALEEIYSGAMDFPSKEAYTKSFCKEHFDLQKL